MQTPYGGRIGVNPYEEGHVDDNYSVRKGGRAYIRHRRSRRGDLKSP